LALSILRLHSDDQRCGHVILKLVQQLSVRLKATISDIAIDHSLLVQLVTFCLIIGSFQWHEKHCMQALCILLPLCIFTCLSVCPLY